MNAPPSRLASLAARWRRLLSAGVVLTPQEGWMLAAILALFLLGLAARMSLVRPDAPLPPDLPALTPSGVRGQP